MKNKLNFLFILCLLVFVSPYLSYAKEVAKKDIIQVEIIKNNEGVVEAKIKNLTDTAKRMNIDKITILGQKIQTDKVTNITWSELALKNKKANLNSVFESKVVAKNKLEEGDIFKAKGSYQNLTRAIDELLIDESAKNNSSLIKKNSSNNSLPGESGSYSSKLSTLSSTKQNPSNINSEAVGAKETTTTGCTPRVDYELNKVFVRERTLIDGNETQSCTDSTTSYVLEKDYKSCPIQTDSLLKKIYYYFLYFYIDSNNSRNSIGNCQIDNTLTKDLKVTKVYTGCNDYVDVFSFKAYLQYKEVYKDSDEKDVVVKDCSIDYDKAYPIIQDYASCGIKHLFDSGYSIQQSKLYYKKDSALVDVQACGDTTIKYTHSVTTDTCKPVVNGNQVSIFNRKYITVDGVVNYITDCTPIDSNTTIESENCLSNPFTHDFTANQSYQNKDYFYYSNNNKVIVASCIKSDEVFIQKEDTDICPSKNDDTKLQSILSARKYIVVDGSKQYITDCAEIATPVPYKDIGYKWVQEYSNQTTSISVANSGDNKYIGSKQGEEVADSSKVIGETKIINEYNISTYSVTGKCDNWTSPSYNGNAIDLALSDVSSVQLNNYIENRTSPEVCYMWCQYYNSITKQCLNSLVRRCFAGESNILYYQRCTNHRCPLSKLGKYPILQRTDGTRYVNNSKLLETKYICGNNSLNGVEVLY